MRCSIENIALPYIPISNVVIQTMAMATINTAVARKTGLQRAAIHNNNGNVETRHRSAGASGRKAKMEHMTARSVRATIPSTASLSDGGSSSMATRPIRNGATVPITTASDPRHWYQIVSADADTSWN